MEKREKHDKMLKRWFWSLNSVQTTRSLVKIHKNSGTQYTKPKWLPQIIFLADIADSPYINLYISYSNVHILTTSINLEEWLDLVCCKLILH